jgi:hypothetical protein
MLTRMCRCEAGTTQPRDGLFVFTGCAARHECLVEAVSSFQCRSAAGIAVGEREVVDFAVNVADRGGGASIPPGNWWK